MAGFYFSTQNNDYFYNNINGEVSVVPPNTSIKNKVVFGKISDTPKINKNKIMDELAGVYTSHLMLIVTEDCNLRCKYCVYSGVYDNQRTHSKKYMSKTVAKKAIDNYIAHLEKIKSKNAMVQPTITFYGGEPLLGFETIKYALEYSNKKYNGLFKYSVTVNGTLLTKEVVDTLVKYDLLLVISLNGNKLEHDKYRIFSNGNGTHDIIMRNLSYIYMHYPDFYQHNISFSTTYDTSTNLIKLSEYFDDPNATLTNKPITISKISSEFTDWYSQFSNEENVLFLKHFEKIRSEFIAALKNQENLTNFQKALFLKPLKMVLNRYIGEKTSVIPFTSPCIPGMKIAVDVSGNLHVCEKINSSRPIGNIDTWIDLDKTVELMSSYLQTLYPRCINCPISRVCGTCYKDVLEMNGACNLPPEDQCIKSINATIETFQIIYDLLESGCDIEEANYE